MKAAIVNKETNHHPDELDKEFTNSNINTTKETIEVLETTKSNMMNRINLVGGSIKIKLNQQPLRLLKHT